MKHRTTRRQPQALLALLVMLAAAARPAMSEAPDPKTSAKPAAIARLAEANTRFGLKLYRRLAEDAGGKNVFLSPPSIGMALAMAANGAEGETREAMMRALELPGMTRDGANEAYSQLRAALSSADPKVQLAVANSLWMDLGKHPKGDGFRPEFTASSERFYGAKVKGLKFKDPRSLLWINGWVSTATHGRIPSMLAPEQLRGSDLILLNAIYFKGAWSKPFDKEHTEDAAFTRAEGGEKSVPMMRQTGRYRYLASEGFQAVSLPYGAGGTSMYLFLPAEGRGLGAFQEQLTPENWEKWMGGFQAKPGTVRLPRFKMSYSADLKPPLSYLGMKLPFTPEANFSAMTPPPAWIDFILHKSFLEVNEEGSEAAASTAIGIGRGGGRDLNAFNLVFNRPFFCAIRDDRSGVLLFLGAVNDPD
jgi:serine protease inhibitor